MCDWPKSVTWPNIPQPKLGNIREYSPIFKTAHMARKIWRIIKTIVAIWGKNMLGYLSLDIICSSYLTVFLELRSRKTVRFSEQIMSAYKYPCIFSRQMPTIVYLFCLQACLVTALESELKTWVGGSPLNWRTFGSVRLVTYFTVPKIAALQNFLPHCNHCRFYLEVFDDEAPAVGLTTEW